MSVVIKKKQFTERELALLEKERQLNQRLDIELEQNINEFPRAVYFIIPNEFGERFCFFGIRNLLNKYLATAFGVEKYVAKSYVHMFNGLAYMFPLVGAAISDSYLGKYHTIVILSVVYLLGNALLSLFSVNHLIGEFGHYPFTTFIIPAIFIAIGTSGIKPCVASHAGDQFLPSQTTLMDRFFSLFFVSINIGALISQYLTPYIKDYVECFGGPCYVLAFGIPTVSFGFALAVFIFGHRYYRIVPAQGEFLPWKACKLTCLALSRYIKASSQERKSKPHWLKFAAPDYNLDFIEETRLLGKMIVMNFPFIFCWVLLDQCGTEWQNQYEKMNKNYFGIISLPTEASGNISSILLITFIMFLSYIVYPFLEKRGYKMRLTSRMAWGYFFIISSFIVSTSLNYIVDTYAVNMAALTNGETNCNECLNGSWQLPQYFLMTLGEALIFPSGLQFAYTQVGKQMKASASSIYSLMVALGNYFVMLMEGPLQSIPSTANRQWVYVGISSFFFLVFIYLINFWYISKEDEDRFSQSFSRINNAVLIISKQKN